MFFGHAGLGGFATRSTRFSLQKGAYQPGPYMFGLLTVPVSGKRSSSELCCRPTVTFEEHTVQ